MQTSHLQVGGAIAFWRLAKSTNREALARGLRDLDLGQFIPEPRSPLSCLRAALDDAYQPASKDERYVIRPHKNSVAGFRVLSEKPKEHVAPGELCNRVVAIAGLRETKADAIGSTLELHPFDYDKEAIIKAGMRGAAEWLPASSVGNTLIELIEHFDGVALRPNGGVYWLRDSYLDRWARVADCFEAASATKDAEGNEVEPSKVYVLRVVADEQMVRAVGDALTQEVEGELAEIEAELAAGDLKPHVCVRRMDKVGQIEQKVKRYENAFGEPMTRLTEAAQKAASNAAMAALQASAAQVAN